MAGRKILILGSGVCGLAVALRVLELEPDSDVTILESEERPGGLARSLEIDGLKTDLGPHRIHTELPDVQEFLHDIAGDDMRQVERRSQMWLRGRWIEYPPKPLEILKVFGPARLAKVFAGFGAEKTAAALGTSKRQHESFESVMTDAFGTELYKLIVLDYVRKVWKTDPRQIHADIARVRVSAGGLHRMVQRVLKPEKPGTETALPRFYYIPGGVERLVDKMRERVEAAGGKIVVERTVEDLHRTEAGRWRVISRGPRGGQRRDTADLLFSTIPVTDLVDMLQRHQPNAPAAAARAEMRFLANFLVGIVVNKPQVTGNQWLYFPGRDTVFNRGYEPANFAEEMGAPGKSLLVLETTCHEGDRIWRASDRQLVEKTKEGLARIGLVREDEIANTFVVRIPHTYPMYDLGYRERLARVWVYLQEFPRLLSVGRQGLFLHNNMDHSIHMGFRAATVALREHPDAPQKHFYREVRRFQKFRIVD